MMAYQLCCKAPYRVFTAFRNENRSCAHATSGALMKISKTAARRASRAAPSSECMCSFIHRGARLCRMQWQHALTVYCAEYPFGTVMLRVGGILLRGDKVRVRLQLRHLELPQLLHLTDQCHADLIPRLEFFFFQAEDGIRDDLVTGVQTCALPI